MDLGLAERTILITGAGSGMGRDMALTFAGEGARVAVNDIDAGAAAETIRLIDETGGTCRTAVADITDLEAVRDMVGRVEAAWGRIDVLVNNAAVLFKQVPYLETDPGECAREVAVILFGTMHCVRAVLPGMIDREYGKIISISTDATRQGQEREANYSAAKGGVVTFCKSIAREAGRHNINVNVVSPAATNSPIRQALLEQLEAKIGADKMAERERKVRRVYPLRRIGEMRDITNAVLFLASDASRHVTGQVLSVNGGYTMVG